MNITVKHFKTLEKKNKSAIFLGCGPSINELSDEEIKFINDNFDVWTSNCFLINKDLIPNFYHMEIKHHRNGPLVDRLAEKRKDLYKDVAWIIDQTRPYILSYVKPTDYSTENIYIYPKKYRQEKNGKYKVSAEDNEVSVSCNASLTVISDLMMRQKYDCIYFLGVDMGDSRYFWTDNPKYKDVKIEDIIKTCKAEERNPDELHPTFTLQDYLPEFFDYNQQKSVNLSRNSLLSKKMETKTIKELMNEYK